MLTGGLDHDQAGCGPVQSGDCPPGPPWSFRLAGARSVRPAVELYEADALLDVVSSTPVAPQLVRGARATAGASCQRVIAWGRLPAAGGGLAVEFRGGTIRRRAAPAAVIKITDWCWIAVADGRFDRVVVSSGARCLQHKLTGGRR
ncbi:MAG TPA: hypothetical protein VGH96_00665 [Streptosporangiaceae bacterium]|jgi:hypothetical protein